MNSEIKNLIDPKLYNTFIEISKKDLILQSIEKKNDNIKDFINALLASIICICDREAAFQELIKTFLESNPKVKEILKAKNDSFLLPKKENL